MSIVFFFFFFFSGTHLIRGTPSSRGYALPKEERRVREGIARRTLFPRVRLSDASGKVRAILGAVRVGYTFSTPIALGGGRTASFPDHPNPSPEPLLVELRPHRSKSVQAHQFIHRSPGTYVFTSSTQIPESRHPAGNRSFLGMK